MNPRIFLRCIVAVILFSGTPNFAADRVRTHTRTAKAGSLPVFMYSFLFANGAAGKTTVAGTTFNFSQRSDSDDLGIATFQVDRHKRANWITPFDGHGLADIVHALTVDVAGNAYVTGLSAYDIDAFEAVALRYGPDGALLWENRFGGEGFPPHVEGTSIAVGASSNCVIVCRTSTNSFLAQIGPDGTSGWQLDLGRGGTPHVAFDSVGDVLVTDSQNDYDAVNDLSTTFGRTIKLSPEGIPLWTNIYFQSVSEVPAALNTDDQGNTFVVFASVVEAPAKVGPKISRSDEDTVAQWTVVAYGPNGASLWTNHLDSVGGLTQPVALAVDTHGSVYVTGGQPSIPGTSKADVLTAKFAANGALMWRRQNVLSPAIAYPLRFGRVTPHRLTIYRDTTLQGDGGLELLWRRTELNYLQRR